MTGSPGGVIMNKIIQWHDSYKGFSIEIRNYKLGSEDAWAYYIILAVEQFPEKDKERLLPELYYTEYGTPIEMDPKDSLLSDVFFHYGITYYRKEHSEGFPFTFLKVGCDFQHYGEEGTIKDVHYVSSEAKLTVDDIIEKFPNIILIKDLIEGFREKFPKKRQEGVYKYDVNGKPMEVK